MANEVFIVFILSFVSLQTIKRGNKIVYIVQNEMSNIKYKIMRKSICTIVLFVCLSPMLKADPPLPAKASTAIADQSNHGIQTQSNPIAPATLLLLGLAGSFAGVKIYKSNKKEE